VRDDRARAGTNEVGDEPSVVVEDLRADRDAHLRGLSGGAVPRPAAAGAAAAGAETLVRAEGGQVAQVRVGDEDDVAAGPAVAAVGAALRHVLLPPEREAAVAAPARLHDDARAVVEHQGPTVAPKIRERGARSRYPLYPVL
jgi:hypothetical protein